MRKCPKCGTTIVDDKKQCYMCGADISGFEQSSVLTDDGFADSFFAQIGGVVSNEQDTIIDDNNAINVNTNDIANTNAIENQSVFVSDNNNNNNNANDTFNSIVSSMMGETSTDAVGATTSLQKNLDSIFDENKTVVKEEPVVQQPKTTFEVQTTVTAEDSDKVDILFANKPKKEKKKFEISKPFIFNTVCFVIFICIVVFVYFKFLKPPVDNVIELGGLSYSINNEFVLTNENEGSKYYNYQNDKDCALRVTYGAANSDSFLSSYFDTVREQYKNNPSYTYQSDEIRINNNNWTGLTIMEMPSDGTSETILRYKYASIVHNASFYHIVFVNLANNQECLTTFNEFMNTLQFN